LSGGLIPAEQFNLPRMEHFDPWPATRLDPAVDTDPSIFEGFNANSSRFESR